MGGTVKGDVVPSPMNFDNRLATVWNCFSLGRSMAGVLSEEDEKSANGIDACWFLDTIADLRSLRSFARLAI
jgi:hypothetical protein